jgi:transcriptional regulator with XRE-family HTH domain
MSQKKQYTHEELVALLNEKKGEKTVTEFAEELKISPPMLSNILCGHRRADGPRVLKFLGLKKVEMYERV